MSETPVHIEEIIDAADGSTRQAEFRSAEEGGFHVIVPSLENCSAQGVDMEDALAKVKKAISRWHELVSGDMYEGM